MKMKTFPKIMLIVVILVGLFFAYQQFGDKIVPAGENGRAPGVSQQRTTSNDNVEVINVGVVTWAGYSGGQYFNGGFQASESSRYYKEYGILVNFIVNDDVTASLEAFKKGDIDVHWWTFDSFSMIAQGLNQYNPKFFFQADWSRKGDVCVATRDIKSVTDLRTKSVAVAFGTPSHTGLLNMLSAGDVRYNEIRVVEVPDAIAAAAAFKAGKVDAAMVWSPDDDDCMANVRGSHRLWDTGMAPFVIADGFFAKGDYIRSHQQELKALVEGWMIGAAEVNSSASAKSEAVRILTNGLGMPEDFCRGAINNVRLTTYGDNVNTFNLNGSYGGVKAEDLYFKTGNMFKNIGILSGDYPGWRQVFDPSILRSINLGGSTHAAEGNITFSKAGSDVATAPAFSTKQLSVTFPTGSATLDANSKTIIDLGFGDIAKMFASLRIRVEGNTDSTGDYDLNVRLSSKRAQACADYLITEYGFDRDRIVVVGRGPDNPVADNNTNDGRSRNRRTDFVLVSQ